MDIRSAVFVKSSDDHKKCPPDTLPEYAFIGRSNVGKSSLINMLTQKKGLAKTSVTPGKTRLINHFLINEAWYLADLPGYGYARTSKAVRSTFAPLITRYLLNRKNLLNTFVLVDCRHRPQVIDQSFMEWMATEQLPFTLVFTKSDKLGKGELISNIMTYKEIMLKEWEELPPSIVTSSISLTGREQILGMIETTNPIFTR